MSKDRPTCGPMFLAGMRAYGSNDEERWLFIAGFVSGQAEKVYLGAADAAMLRPSSEQVVRLRGIVDDVAERYQLVVVDITYPYPGGPNEPTILRELWLCRTQDVADDVYGLPNMRPNSPEFHGRRARLCGVPSLEVDYEFHRRRGSGVPCDIIEEQPDGV